LPENAREKVAQFLACLERNGNNRTNTARELGISVRTVRYWLKNLQDQAPPPPTAKEVAATRIDRRPWTECEIEQMLDLNRQGWTPDEIAVELQRTKSSVASKLWQHWQDLWRKGKWQ
jgi:DNA-binding NarL/FixJ family response regulator